MGTTSQQAMLQAIAKMRSTFLCNATQMPKGSQTDPFQERGQGSLPGNSPDEGLIVWAE